ncbi:MAG: biotin/lipoyl-binding protein, partial [Ferruginibacter sp.]
MKFTGIRIYFSTILLICFCLAVGCNSKKKQTQSQQIKAGPPPAPHVDGYVVKVSSLSDNLELPGSIIANEETEIHPEISGRMTFLNAAEGKVVGRGTLIAKIYDGDLRAQLNKLRVQLKVQEQTAKRYEELLKINGVSQQEYDMIALQSNNIRADMAIVQSNIMRTEVR